MRLAMTHAYLGDFATSRTNGTTALREAERASRPDCAGKALFALASASYGTRSTLEAIDYATRAIPLLGGAQTRY